MTRTSLIHCPHCPYNGPLQSFIEGQQIEAFDAEGLLFCPECELQFHVELATLVEDEDYDT